MNETFCGTKNDLETPTPTTVGKEPETGTTTAVGNPNPNDPRPSLATGGSLFPPGTPFATNPTSTLPKFDPKDTTSVTIVDVDGDGDEDIVVTTVGGETTNVYLNPGNGDFSAVEPIPLGPPGEATPRPDSSSVQVIDLNGDGAPDIVVGNKDGQNEIYLGDPSKPGTFDTQPLMFGESGDVTKDVKVVDVDLDGSLDIVVANDGQTNKVYYGDPTLPIGSSPTYGQNPSRDIGVSARGSTSVEVADLNGDGRPDILIGNDGTRDEIFMGSGPAGTRQDLATETPTLLFGTTGMRTSDIKVGDVTGDGIPDIVVASIGETNLLYPGRPSGSGTFANEIPSFIGRETDNSMSVQLVDTDNDGDLDVVFGNADSTASTYTNQNGALGLSPTVTGQSSIESAGMHHVADFNGDGIPDLVTGRDIVFGDGSGNFFNGQRVPYNTGTDIETPRTVASVDIDNDGELDLVVSPRGPGPYGDSSPYYLLNPGSGDFSKATMVKLNAIPDRHTEVLTPMDLNGDGLMDMVLGNSNGNAEVWMNPGPNMAAYNAATFELPDSPDVTDIEVADINKDGLKDIVMVVKGRGVVRTILNPGTPGVPSSIGGSAMAWIRVASIDKRPPSRPDQIELADVNKDGNLDMIVGTDADIVFYLGADCSSRRLADASSCFGDAPVLVGNNEEPPLSTQDLEVADVDGDGWLDIVGAYDPAVYNTATSPHHRRIFYGSSSAAATPSRWTHTRGERLGPVGESEWDIESLDIVDLNADGECRHQLRRLRAQRLALFCALSFVPCFACLLARVLALHDIALLTYGSDVRVCVRARR